MLDELLRSAKGPHVVHLVNEDYRLLSRIEAAGISVVQLDGVAMKTWPAVFISFGEAFRFPSRVENWDAFEDWMRDLSWLNETGAGWVVRISRARYLLAGQESAKAKLVDSLAFIGSQWAEPVNHGEWWDRPPIPFHTLIID